MQGLELPLFITLLWKNFSQDIDFDFIKVVLFENMFASTFVFEACQRLNDYGVKRSVYMRYNLSQ